MSDEREIFKSTKTLLEYLNSEETRKKLPYASKLIQEIEIVSGGLSNYVYRLRQDDKTTLILKYFPPFVAAYESVPFSQSRYQVEKQALEIFANESCLTTSRVKTPKVSYSDDELHFIIMEDCGEHTMTMFKFLQTDNKLTESEINSLLDDFARELTKFLSMLANDISIKVETHMDPFANKPIWDCMNRFCSYAQQAKAFGLEKELAIWIENFKKSEQPKENACFVQGDFWPNSILIDVEKRIYWFVDWEMARFQTPYSDLEQFNANLWIMKQNPELFNSHSIHYLIGRLQHEYFGSETADWRIKCGSYAKTQFILFLLVLIREKHWQIESARDVILKALEEVSKLSN